ncbi:helix-turn-helix domain-containing protein [Paraburkholderia azotifigens]|uniref:Helix-turn-helix domain-containing protein n=1 Tax=Paraburkholderia azotifigens TaxID=2057004 RepID=A0ABU9R2W2_9BURK
MCDATLSMPIDYAQAGAFTWARADRSPIQSKPGACDGCARRQGCIANDLDGDALERLDAIMHSTRIIRQGETLFRAGDVFRSIYSVRTGSFKTVIAHRDGMEHVSGFQLPGDVMGFDCHEVSAMALEDSTVCVVPFSLLEKECAESRALQHQVHTLMSAEIVRESALMMLLGVMSAEERVAAFLINIATRMQQRGFSASSFNLRMTRDEIGSYLGLTLETVSRMLSRFHKDGLIRAGGKRIDILDPDGLRAV